jgi:hypothetical protein
VKAIYLTDTIKNALRESFGVARTFGPKVHPEDPNSLVSQLKEMGEQQFFEFLKKTIDAAVEYSAPSGYKLKKHEMRHGSFDFEYESEDEQIGTEVLSFSFSDKKGYLEITYSAEEVTGTTRATHLDPAEHQTREIYNTAQIFSAHELKDSIDDALDEVIEPPNYEQR